MAQHFKIHELLSASQLEELETFAREPGRTIDECAEWLAAAGFVVSRSAVGNWKAAFDGQCMQERFGRASEIARAIKDGVDQSSFGNVADAAVMQLVQVIFEQAVKLDSDGAVKSGDLLNMAIALKSTIGSKEQLTKALAEKFDRESKRLSAERRAITDEDIAAVRKAVFG